MMRPDFATRYGDERLPRYTSYPTSPHFSASVGASAYGRWLAEISPETTASLYLHIPFCRAMCWYCGCNTSVAKRDDIIETYVAALRHEVEQVTRLIPRRQRVQHVHFGGGTPTILQPNTLVELVRLLRQSFDLAADAEVAIEIDPRTLDKDTASALAGCGVNRASLGIQSFDPLVQQSINRTQTVAQTASVVAALRRRGVNGINFDLIYGLPHQTVASCIETVLRCVELRPDRFSVFGYAHVPGFKPHQRRIAENSLPDGAERYRQFEAIADLLGDCGYQRIGLDHFCLPDDVMSRTHSRGELRRNFQGYTTDASNILLGFGASAIGRLQQGYVQNEAGVRAYMEAVTSDSLATVKGYVLTDEDRLRGEIIERIMCDFGADIGRICERHCRVPHSVLGASSRLEQLVEDGIVTVNGSSLRVADDARFLVRTVAAAFDSHLGQSGASHSRAV